MKLRKKDFFITINDWGVLSLALTVEGDQKLGLETREDKERFYDHCKSILAKHSNFPKIKSLNERDVKN